MSSITKPSQKPRDFIQGAPDARPAGKRRAAVATTQTTIVLADEVLQRLDEMARQTGQSRSALIKIGITRVLRDGL